MLLTSLFQMLGVRLEEMAHCSREMRQFGAMMTWYVKKICRVSVSAVPNEESWKPLCRCDVGFVRSTQTRMESDDNDDPRQ